MLHCCCCCLLLLQEHQEAGLLTSELCIGWRCTEELRCKGEHGRAVEGGELAQLFGGEGGLEGPAAVDDEDVVLRLLERWGVGTRRVLRVPVDERKRGDDVVRR